MTSFVLSALLLLVLTLALLFRPYFWRSEKQQISHRRVNAAVYRDQQAKLDNDLSDGLLNDTDHQTAGDELRRRMLDEASEESRLGALVTPKKTMLALALVLPLAAGGIYWYLGQPDGLIITPEQPNPTQQDVEKMVASLAQKLQADPSNKKGWTMLARSYKVMGRPLDAQQAYEKAGDYINNDAQLLADYADVVATNANGNFTGKPQQLIDQALKVDPQNPMALWLAGSAALAQSNFKLALAHWNQLLTLLPADSQDAKELQGAINEAREKSGLPALAQMPVSTPKSPAASGPSVQGELTLSPALQGKVSPDDAVLIIARAPGQRMPVAVLRARVSQLPLQFTLDDSLSMSPVARISMTPKVEVEARISKTGMANPEPGDLISQVQTVAQGVKGMKLVVDMVRP